MGTKALIGMKTICGYLNIGRKVFYALVQAGAPFSNDSGVWCSHEDAIDEYFRERAKNGQKINLSRKKVSP